ncbi:ATP-binding protein [Agromyces sp. SYSU T00266]|uniref:ATP-binding protein n=1 Tax=Agromyces zhanjiangensis TaxID=3158562 RepID=UPI0033989756
MATGLLERAPEGSALRAAALEARGGRGRVVLVHGEAGIGKTSLVESLRADPPAGTRVLVGACDAMTTPRTLGPLRDLAPDVGEALRSALRGGEREDVFAALQDELAGSPGTILVIEDLHWADEATLDALRFLGRRIDRLPAVLVLTYRDELDRDHPLNRLLGDLGHGDRIERMPLGRLSPASVDALTEGSGLTGGRVYELTRGNPYFVTELVASADADGVPPTVVDAVTGRLRRLDPAEQDDVEQLAVMPALVGPDLLARLVSGGPGALRAAEERGLLSVRPEGVQFRHELTRRAVVDGLPASRRIELERLALAALLASGSDDAARIVHHAIEAGDGEAIVEWAPRAAQDAAASGAHREAVSHLRAALAHADRYAAAELAELTEQYAVESYTLGAAVEAADVQATAVELRRPLGDAVRLGASLRWLSRLQWMAGHRADAEAAAEEAIEVLAAAGDRGTLALALSNRSQLALLVHDCERARDISAEAIAIAREAGDRAVLSHALNNHGTAIMQLGDDAGMAELAESAEIALADGDMENASRALANLIWILLDEYRLDLAEERLSHALDVAEQAEFIGMALYHRVEQARLDLARARWDDAQATIDTPATVPHSRCVGLYVGGLARLRRGDGDVDPLLDEAWEIAAGIGEIQRTGPAGAALAEAALLRGDPERAREIAAPLFAEAHRRRAHGVDAELAYLLRASGAPVEARADDEHPFAVQARGDWRRAADLWHELGCPYHEARALAESPDDADLLEALAILDRIDARPLARIVRADLRDRGVRNVPRGPSTGTRRNPVGLTDRQVDVLRLLADGLTNAEIAERLVVSVRTVDSHVAAVLAKLGVSSRRDAVREARALGLVDASDASDVSDVSDV